LWAQARHQARTRRLAVLTAIAIAAIISFTLWLLNIRPDAWASIAQLAQGGVLLLITASFGVQANNQAHFAADLQIAMHNQERLARENAEEREAAQEAISQMLGPGWRSSLAVATYSTINHYAQVLDVAAETLASLSPRAAATWDIGKTQADLVALEATDPAAYEHAIRVEHAGEEHAISRAQDDAYDRWAANNPQPAAKPSLGRRIKDRVHAMRLRISIRFRKVFPRVPG
jgi:hypothetical protein